MTDETNGTDTGAQDNAPAGEAATEMAAPAAKIPTTTAEWLSAENPHNVETFGEFKSALQSALQNLEDFLSGVPDEVLPALKADFSDLKAKVEELIHKL